MTPVYHDNVDQFRRNAECKARQTGGVPKTLSPSTTEARTKHAQVAAPDFSTQQAGKGQLALPKRVEKWTTGAPQNQSKNNTKNHKETKAVSSAKYD